MRRLAETSEELLRDETGWERVEQRRLDQKEQQRRAAEAKRRHVREAGAQTQAVACAAGHELRPARRPGRTWVCDGCGLPGGCRVGVEDLGPHRTRRLRCDICDYDLCAACHEEALRRGGHGAAPPGGGVAPASSGEGEEAD